MTVRKKIVVVGNGMVGHRFVEKLVEFDTDKKFEIITFCEEPVSYTHLTLPTICSV